MGKLTDLDTRTVYYRVIEIANIFVSKRAYLSIQALKDFDPSVQEFADMVRGIAEILQAIAGDFSDENMAVNAFQCSLDLHRLARAATNEDQNEVDVALDALSKHCSGPY